MADDDENGLDDCLTLRQGIVLLTVSMTFTGIICFTLVYFCSKWQ